MKNNAAAAAPGPIAAQPATVRTDSLDYVIDQEQRLVTISGGYADAEEWKYLLSRLLHDPRHAPGFAFLRDLRRAGAASSERVDPVVDAIRWFWPLFQPCRGAVLTAGDSARAAVAIEVLASVHHLPVRMFDSYEAAVTWLESGT